MTTSSETWVVTTLDDGTRCVYPTNDLRPHTIEGECWCDPFEDDGVIVHNSMDRREEHERGQPMS
jgi:hypothetical protein